MEPDRDVSNADWLRARAWDLWYIGADDRHHLVDSIEGLKQVVTDIDAFLKLPAARPMPDSLRKELTKAGYEVPPKLKPRKRTKP